MKNIYNNIALRSLNQVKTLNPIMYMSIRCFFEDFAISSSQNGLFSDFIERKLKVRKDWSTKPNKLFKEKKGDSFIYRDTLSLSAFGIVAESYLLRLISQQNCINKEYVYSYSLPQRVNSTRNFKYYFNGFKRRNEDVHNMLKSDNELIAVVLDLTKFYPTINKENVKQLFFKELDDNSEDDILSIVKNITSSILEQSIDGVPIGRDLGHLMGQVYLNQFDKELSNKYPKKYFRYVDDIIILCDKSDKSLLSKLKKLKWSNHVKKLNIRDFQYQYNEVCKKPQDHVIEYVQSQLPDKLEINKTKTDVLTLENWSLLNTSNDNEKESNLYEVLNFITAYISMHPLRIESLENEIKSLGYNIPLSRIKKQAKSKGFMSYIKSLTRNDKRYGIFEIYFTKNEYIVQQLINLQKIYRIKLKKLLELNYDDTNSAKNRSNTQQLKYTVNQLLYLSNTEELLRIKNALPNTKKFEDTKEVINALSSKNLTNAIQYGGKVIQTISELWNENNFEMISLEKNNLEIIQNIDDVIDSLIILYLYKVIKFNILDILDLLNDYNKEYVRVVLCDKYIMENQEYEFLLELQGLFKGRDLNDKHNLLTTRYDNDEDIQLAGLDLGLAYSI